MEDTLETPLFAHYDRLVKDGSIKDDPSQHKVLEALERLSLRLEKSSRKQNGFFKKSPSEKQSDGLYIWGSVGRGKSMLMDLFFQHVDVRKKRRVHFHAFMQEIHARIHGLRQKTERAASGADPVIKLAQELAEETTLLCFDELQAADVADATLLFRLFNELFNSGVSIVSTSNFPPGLLYTGGVQRERFAKFISLIEERMEVISLTSELDYRKTQIRSLEKRYVWPLSKADGFVADALQRLCRDDVTPKEGTLAVHGRRIPFRLYNHSIGYFSFAELCESLLGPADYLALSKRCDTIILAGIPRLTADKRNEARRFVTLIDTLYERKVKLLCTAEVPPEQIYSEGDGAFEFQRTVSRLNEMQSKHWGEG